VPVAGGAVVVTFVMSFLGAALHLPDWVLGLSPFHHLSLAPAQPVAWVSTLVMVGIAAGLAAAGTVAFARRDLQ
jgi:ABC-2 type transport system permease protein